jgi:hypothetical protein
MGMGGVGIGDKKEKIRDGHPLRIHPYLISSPTFIPIDPYPFYNPGLSSASSET